MNPEERWNALQKIAELEADVTEHEAAGEDPSHYVEFRKAVADLQELYPDITRDAQTWHNVQVLDDAMVRAGDRRPYRQRYEAIGNFVEANRYVDLSRYNAAELAQTHLGAPSAAPNDQSDLEIIRALQMGSEEDALAALKTLRQSVQHTAAQTPGGGEDYTNETDEAEERSRTIADMAFTRAARNPT